MAQPNGSSCLDEVHNPCWTTPNAPRDDECAVPVIVQLLSPVLPSFLATLIILFWSIRRYIYYLVLLCVPVIFAPAWVPNSSRLRYWVVLASLVTINLVNTSMFIPIVFLLWFIPKIASRYIWLCSSFFAKVIGVEVVFRNPENLEGKGKGVIIMNHMTILDTLVGCINNLHFGDWVPIVKSELGWYGPYGIALRMNDAIFINRSSKSKMSDLSKAAKQRFSRPNKNTRLILYPEGTRNDAVFSRDERKLLPFKLGAFRLAVENGVPIFPLVVSKYYFCQWPYRFERGIVVVKALEPIYVDPKEELETVAQRTRETMEKEFANLSEEVRIIGEANKSDGFWSGIILTFVGGFLIYIISAIYQIIEAANCFDESFGEVDN